MVGAEASRARRSEPRRLARNIFLRIVAVSMFIFKTLSDECASAASFSTGALRTGNVFHHTVVVSCLPYLMLSVSCERASCIQLAALRTEDSVPILLSLAIYI